MEMKIRSFTKKGVMRLHTAPEKPTDHEWTVAPGERMLEAELNKTYKTSCTTV